MMQLLMKKEGIGYMGNVVMEDISSEEESNHLLGS